MYNVHIVHRTYKPKHQIYIPLALNILTTESHWCCKFPAKNSSFVGKIAPFPISFVLFQPDSSCPTSLGPYFLPHPYLFILSRLSFVLSFLCFWFDSFQLFFPSALYRTKKKRSIQIVLYGGTLKKRSKSAYVKKRQRETFSFYLYNS